MSALARISYRLKDAAEATGVSEDVLRRAIKATDPKAYPPPLKAKRAGSDKKVTYLILGSELERWVGSLGDA